jgi:prepilin-type N-terminal cleavage/methylation domain-containing protein
MRTKDRKPYCRFIPRQKYFWRPLDRFASLVKSRRNSRVPESMGAGFTLIELLLVISLVLILGTFTSAFFTRFIYQMAVRDTSEALVGIMHEAQEMAMSGKENSSWGVRYESGRVILFCGNSYLSRDPSFDQVLETNSHINVANFEETVFEAPSGRPSVSSSRITVSWDNVEEIFTLNSEGAIED